MSAQIFKTRPPLAFSKPPWRIDLDRVLARSRVVAIVGDPTEGTPIEREDEEAANAVLIAVAPAMYLCLRAVRAYYTAMWSGDAKRKAPPFLRAITDLLDAIEPRDADES